MSTRVAVVSDVHGADEHLRRISGVDATVVLGDLINLIDYRTMEGILVDVFGREHVGEAVRLRSEGRHEEARNAIRGDGADPEDTRARFVDLAREQYERVLDALPKPAYVTYGNADIPELLRELLPGDVRLIDGETFEIDGERWGLVGGGMPTPLAAAGEVPEAEYDLKLDALGDVDVVGTHMPPRIPWYVYDVLGKRFEPGSTGLIAFIGQRSPRRSYFGHVHQPLVGRGVLGSTELVNVGYFRGTGTPTIHET